MNTVVLLSPEIPQNTGNIVRLCAVTGTQLHLVGKLGFSLQDKYLKRAGLDYWDSVIIKHFPDIIKYFETCIYEQSYLLSSKVDQIYSSVAYPSHVILFFGNEGSGTPYDIMKEFIKRKRALTIPMKKEQRCINLAVSVGIVLYEVLRQHMFPF